jgi:hypothetical protein
MACLISTIYTVPCKSAAGVSEVYIGNFDSSLAYIIGTASPNLNKIISFTGGTSSFYRYEQPTDTGSFVNTGNNNIQNNSKFYNQAVEITLHNLDQTLFDTVDNLMAAKLRSIVKDNNGNYLLMGLTRAMDVTSNAGGLGKSMGDNNGYVLTISGTEPKPAIQLTTAAALQLIQLT